MKTLHNFNYGWPTQLVENLPDQQLNNLCAQMIKKCKFVLAFISSANFFLFPLWRIHQGVSRHPSHILSRLRPLLLYTFYNAMKFTCLHHSTIFSSPGRDIKIFPLKNIILIKKEYISALPHSRIIEITLLLQSLST